MNQQRASGGTPDTERVACSIAIRRWHGRTSNTHQDPLADLSAQGVALWLE